MKKKYNHRATLGQMVEGLNVRLSVARRSNGEFPKLPKTIRNMATSLDCAGYPTGPSVEQRLRLGIEEQGNGRKARKLVTHLHHLLDNLGVPDASQSRSKRRTARRKKRRAARAACRAA